MFSVNICVARREKMNSRARPKTDLLYKKLIRLNLGLTMSTVIFYTPRAIISFMLIRKAQDPWIDIVRMWDTLLFPTLGLVHLYTLHTVLPRKKEILDKTVRNVNYDMENMRNIAARNHHSSPNIQSAPSKSGLSSFYFNRSGWRI